MAQDHAGKEVVLIPKFHIRWFYECFVYQFSPFFFASTTCDITCRPSAGFQPPSSTCPDGGSRRFSGILFWTGAAQDPTSILQALKSVQEAASLSSLWPRASKWLEQCQGSLTALMCLDLVIEEQRPLGVPIRKIPNFLTALNGHSKHHQVRGH